MTTSRILASYQNPKKRVILPNSVIRHGHLSDAILSSTVLAEIDLSRTKGLESVRHEGPSTIGIDTIFLSKGMIPEVFLRRAGVPESFISQVKALVSALEPIQFYSCFISYSSKDHDFAKRLHADLQQQAVRCWFAPEDMKIGDPFRPRIDEAIRLYDKLLLC
jgi:TIR domain